MTAFFQGGCGRRATLLAGLHRARRADRARRSSRSARAMTLANDHRPRRPVGGRRRAARDHRDGSARSAIARIEINIIGNVAEDARRTGDWDWVIGGARARRRQSSSTTQTRSCSTRRIGDVRGARGERHGRCPRAARCAARRRSRTVDVEVGRFDLGGLQAFSRGDFGTAAAAVDGRRRCSDFNAPYILPRVAVAVDPRSVARMARRRSIRALDRAGHEGTVHRRRPAHHRGRASPRLPAIATAALAGYRAGLAAYRDLSLPGRRGVPRAPGGHDARCATTPRSPGGSTTRATILTRLGADPVLGVLDESRSRRRPSPGGTEAGTPRRSGVADRLTARVRAGRAARGSRPGRASRSPAGPRRRGR